MKNTIIIITFCVICLFATGWVNTSAQDNNLNILTTVFPAFDFARTVGGEAVEVSQLLPPGADTHTYEPSPRDVLRIRNADLFIYVGGESENWIDAILESLGDDAPETLKLIDTVNAVPEEVVEGMQEEEDPEEGLVYDEHIWTSPANAILMTQAISRKLSELDSANTANYETNTAAHIAELEKLDEAYQDMIGLAKHRTIIVGDRFPFRYLADAYGLDYYAAFPGCSAVVEPSAATIAFLIDKVKAEQIPVIFYIEFSNQKIANTIAEATGAKTLLLHSAHNVSGEEIDAGVTYLSLMNENLPRLREALE